MHLQWRDGEKHIHSNTIATTITQHLGFGLLGRFIKKPTDGTQRHNIAMCLDQQQTSFSLPHVANANNSCFLARAPSPVLGNF